MKPFTALMLFACAALAACAADEYDGYGRGYSRSYDNPTPRRTWREGDTFKPKGHFSGEDATADILSGGL